MKTLKNLLLTLLLAVSGILNEKTFTKKVQLGAELVYYMGHASELLTEFTEYCTKQHPLLFFFGMLGAGAAVSRYFQNQHIAESNLTEAEGKIIKGINEGGTDKSPPNAPEKTTAALNPTNLAIKPTYEIQQNTPETLNAEVSITRNQTLAPTPTNIFDELTNKQKIIFVFLLKGKSYPQVMQLMKFQGVEVKLTEIEKVRDKMTEWVDDDGNVRITNLEWELELERTKSKGFRQARSPAKNVKGNRRN